MGFRDWLHGQGVDVHGQTIDQALEMAGLNWEVKTGQFRYGDQYQYREKDHKIAYRADTGKYLGTYNKRQPWQNREIVEMFANFCQGAGLELGWLAQLKGGVELLAGAQIPQSSEMGDDRTDHYLLLRDSHATGNGLKVSLYSSRTICTNGCNIVVRDRTIAHTSTLEISQSTVTETLNGVIRAIKEREAVHQQLAQTTIEPMEAHLQLIAAFGNPEKSIDEQPKVVKHCLKLFQGAGTGMENLTCYNTAYGLLQAVTEYYNWEAPRSTSQSALQSLLEGSRARAMGNFEKQLVSVCLR